MTNAQQIAAAARNAGWESANDTLVTAVLNGTAMIATTGAGVSRELADFILSERRMPTAQQLQNQLDHIKEIERLKAQRRRLYQKAIRMHPVSARPLFAQIDELDRKMGPEA